MLRSAAMRSLSVPSTLVLTCNKIWQDVGVAVQWMRDVKFHSFVQWKLTLEVDLTGHQMNCNWPCICGPYNKPGHTVATEALLSLSRIEGHEEEDGGRKTLLCGISRVFPLQNGKLGNWTIQSKKKEGTVIFFSELRRTGRTGVGGRVMLNFANGAFV